MQMGPRAVYGAPPAPGSGRDSDEAFERAARERAERAHTQNVFIGALRTRLDQGAKDYGEKSFSRSLPELLGELEQELLDQAGWAYVSWCKIQRMKAALAEAERATERGPANEPSP